MVRAQPGHTLDHTSHDDVPTVGMNGDTDMRELMELLIRLKKAGRIEEAKQLVIAMARPAKLISLTEPPKEQGDRYTPCHLWVTIVPRTSGAPGVQMMRAMRSCFCPSDTTHVLIRVTKESLISDNDPFWSEVFELHLSDDTWSNIPGAPGVQILRYYADILVRTIETP